MAAKKKPRVAAKQPMPDKTSDLLREAYRLEVEYQLKQEIPKYTPDFGGPPTPETFSEYVKLMQKQEKGRFPKEIVSPEPVRPKVPILVRQAQNVPFSVWERQVREMLEAAGCNWTEEDLVFYSDYWFRKYQEYVTPAELIAKCIHEYPWRFPAAVCKAAHVDPARYQKPEPPF